MRLACVCAGAILLCVYAPVASGEERVVKDSVAVARELYSSAQYEEALGMLDRLRAASAPADDIAPVEQYRAFCLMALGRSSEADEAIAALVRADPAFVPAEAAAAPRLRAAFRDVRRRLLPLVIQQRYDTARGLFERREFAAAAAGFSDVLSLMADPDIIQASTSVLADLKTLAEGFRDLSTRASAPAEPLAASHSAAMAPAPVPAMPSVFSASDANVVAPVIVKQSLPAFPAQWGVKKAGVLEVVIDERGFIESAVMRGPMHPRYDPMVVDAARSWRYEPATRDGAAVKYRKMVQIAVSSGDRR